VSIVEQTCSSAHCITQNNVAKIEKSKFVYFLQKVKKHTTDRIQRKDHKDHQSLLHLWQLL